MANISSLAPAVLGGGASGSPPYFLAPHPEKDVTASLVNLMEGRTGRLTHKISAHDRMASALLMIASPAFPLLYDISFAIGESQKSKEIPMTAADSSGKSGSEALGGATAPMKLEVIVLPVSDFERAAEFYARLGWRKDADVKDGARRLLQFTPPGSACSVMFGSGTTPSAPGTSQFVHLAVSDVVAARADLIARGIEVSQVYHAANGGYNPYDPAVRVNGLHPERASYRSFVTFADPDGNSWLLQEITARKEGRLDATATTFASISDLADALRRASAAHDEREKRIGQRDANWADWYAAYLAAEQSGAPSPL